MNSSAQLDRSFLAFSHPVRRAIVARLARGPATVGEATGGLGVSKPASTMQLMFPDGLWKWTDRVGAAAAGLAARAAIEATSRARTAQKYRGGA